MSKFVRVYNFVAYFIGHRIMASLCFIALFVAYINIYDRLIKK